MSKKDSENISHIVAVRFRVTGSGNLKTTLYSYDSFKSSVLANIALLTTTNVQPTILANFRDQRIQIDIRTTEINEYFNIDKIIPFVKESATGYPQ